MGKGQRFIIVSLAVMAAAALFMIGLFYWLFDASRKNVLGVWENESIQAARDVRHYLTMPMDAVEFSAITVNGMLARGAVPYVVWQYLINETKIYSSVINENTTGVYGYYKGHYLDGSQWTPPDDYEPTERPWYKKAVEEGGEIALVKPYLNLQTFTMMMSVSKLLDDGESVVSMDIFLDSVQRMAEERIKDSAMRSALVMDRDGFVVAHSDPADVGKDYAADGDPFEKMLVEKITAALSDGQTSASFEIRGDYGAATVFVDEINAEWVSVLILDENEMFRSLNIIYLFSAASFIAVMMIMLSVVLTMDKRRKEAESLAHEVAAVADVYEVMVRVDLETDRFSVLRGNDDFDPMIGGQFSEYSSKARELAERMSADQSRDILVKFVDVGTMAERLSELGSISQEFLDVKNRWVRMRFIVVDRKPTGEPWHLLWAFESIDEDRKQQEHLRRLSETDMMTGIRNRGSGEAEVRKEMAEGNKGMFLLMDADHFKSVNDNYGHGVGDKVIIAIADCMKSTFRDSDVVFRLGGDEFAAFVSGVDTEEVGENVINRFFKNIDGINIPELGDRKIQMSVGATFYPADRNDSFEEMYKRADAGTYESKKTEGNCFTFEEQEEIESLVP